MATVSDIGNLFTKSPNSWNIELLFTKIHKMKETAEAILSSIYAICVQQSMQKLVINHTMEHKANKPQ